MGLTWGSFVRGKFKAQYSTPRRYCNHINATSHFDPDRTGLYVSHEINATRITNL
jgi:hypothetical protein